MTTSCPSNSPNQITEITSHMHEALPANTRSVDEHAVLVRVQLGTNVEDHDHSNLLMSAFNIDKTIQPTTQINGE